ncbi:MAG TPA: cobalamin biosynthesis protein CbiX [Comamonadaceae bacterium]|uniref:sirohydrochlorin chelatase n=1 Tax=Pulveribacter sp. TaxID=2678893 RepID=UPI000EEBE163|nr:CbiX/SirB N-terminal domain-containing protein [Pulveribacter sp.]HCL86377.1 cobalamin biosynthesis protein CbiX [Comamonadaceae bacterium]
MVGGVILFAHGSRDPLWRAPMEAVRARLQAAQPQLPCRCAYLELCEPPLDAAVAELAALKVTHIAIVPLFLGAGRHVREDLPGMAQALAAAHPGLRITLSPPIGEDERMVALMADIAAEAVSLEL